ncbi:MAG: hypothetical protein FWC32_08555 [Firmicutes bacterium]|nr:hypothetical protein [Bacillota bacterium]
MANVKTLHQIVLQNEIPFEVKIPKKDPLNYATLSESQFNIEMEKGLADLSEGRITPSSEIRRQLHK